MTNGGAPARMTAFCFKCHKKTEVRDIERVTLKNGRTAIKGTCLTCGTKVSRIGM